jgi:hypothetical protein
MQRRPPVHTEGRARLRPVAQIHRGTSPKPRPLWICAGQ